MCESAKWTTGSQVAKAFPAHPPKALQQRAAAGSRIQPTQSKDFHGCQVDTYTPSAHPPTSPDCILQ